jgi:hypothetical protein
MFARQRSQVGTFLPKWSVAVGAVLVLSVVVSAARGADYVRIEEDWQLVVQNPDPDTFAPQVTTTLAPKGNLDSLYAVFDLNLRALPSYVAGGMQLQLWNGTDPVESVKSNTGSLLENNGETVTWTQRMSVADGVLSFSIVNGNSQTWGNFGAGQSISVSGSIDLTNLNQYDPAVSVANSGIGFAANRVSSLTLVRVRAYSAEKLEAEDNTARVLYQND